MRRLIKSCIRSIANKKKNKRKKKARGKPLFLAQQKIETICHTSIV
jgi:hypothetical protein